MAVCCGFNDLKHDLERKKQIVLFVGAGINATSDPVIDMSWNSLMDMLFSDALRFLAIEKDISTVEMNIIRQGLNKKSLDNQNKFFSDLLRINETLDYELTQQIKASIVKEILGDNYIMAIQKFLYSQCNKRLIRRKFQEAYSLKNKEKEKKTYPFYTLYTMARMIILYPYIKAVVTYNYDNFLKEAISILLESREEYFTLDELERIGKRNLVIQDVSGFVYAQEMTDDILSIYHVHGYIQPPSESFIADNNQIVLSLDEYHENEKNIYSWPTATQLHFLSHYTCILAGMSLTDPTPQRMLYFVKRSGNDDKIYYLSANGNPNIKNEQYLKAYSSIREVKNVYHAKCGLNVIYNREGYFQLYKELNTIVDNLNIYVMGVFDNAKKVPTGVCGLDSLFYDGLQLQNFNEKDSSSENKSRNKEKGLIIMLKGVRGINKMHLAMQMLHGISRSIYSIPGLSKYASVPYFFSLNKTKEDLSDFFLDYLITRQIDIIIRKSASGEDASWKQDILAKSLFTVDRCSEQCVQNANHSVYLPKDYRNCLDKYLCDRIIYYNNRTNALHFLRDYEGDDDDNLLFHRRSDDLTYYWGKGKDNLRFLPQYMRDDFFDVRFNERLSGEDFFDCDNTMYSYSAGQKFQKVLDCLENIEMENAEKQEVAEDNDRDKQNGCSRSWARQYSPCIVIDGFAQLHTDELERLSFPHIEKVLRRLSMVSILVFDERANNITCNADIVIDMRKKEYADEDYAFHELQISKSVFQPAAFGWHKYKIRNCGIEVYPSIHRLLQRRNYMSKILTHTHANILDESYERFMRTERLQYHNIADPNISYDNYQAEKSDREMDLLKEMYRKGKEARLRLTKKIIPKHYATDILEAVLLGGPMKSPLDENCYHTDDRKMHALGSSSRWREYKSVTALIGNPNSFKRFLAIARTFRASKHKEHTLVILFDKEEDEMRRQFICPGFNTYEADFLPCLELMDLSEQDKLDELNSNNKDKRENVYPKYPINNRRCSTCSYKCKLKECCLRCYKYIHFLNVRMGCISADELYSVLKQQINVPYFDGINQKKVSRIVIDDLQKIDYSFPLLKDEHLFLTALVTLCRENDVELQILCDKKAGLTKELCSLADNVVCINRDKADTNSIVLYLERFAEHISPSEIIQYNIDNISELFKCDGADIRLDAIVREEKDEIKEIETNISNTPGQGDTKADSMSNETECFKACIKFKCIGSMKDYWRMKIDIGNTRQV